MSSFLKALAGGALIGDSFSHHNAFGIVEAGIGGALVASAMTSSSRPSYTPSASIYVPPAQIPPLPSVNETTIPQINTSTALPPAQRGILVEERTRESYPLMGRVNPTTRFDRALLMWMIVAIVFGFACAYFFCLKH